MTDPTPRAAAAGDQLLAEIAERANIHARTLIDRRVTAAQARLVESGINAGVAATFEVLRAHGWL